MYFINSQSHHFSGNKKFIQKLKKNIYNKITPPPHLIQIFYFYIKKF